MQSSKTLFYLFIILLILFGLGIGYVATRNPVQISKDRLQVATSFYPLYFFTKELAGDRADVFNITPAGAEPHDYEPTAKEVARIQSSKMLVINGSVEPWAKDLEQDLIKSGVLVITAGANLLSLGLDEEGEKTQDPHIWLDPELAKQEATKILAGLKQVDPQNSAYYEANAIKLNAKLDALNSEFKTGLNSCKQKDIVTSHAAFGYLAKAFGLNQVAISGLSPDEEPSTQRIKEIADYVKKNNIKYIFFEALVSPKLSQTIASETGAGTLVLDPLEGVSDEASQTGADYFTIMRSNLKNIQTALQCI